MIVEWFLDLAAGVLGFFFGLIPASPAEDELVVSANNLFEPFMQGIAGLGVWLPWGTLVLVGPIVFNIYLLSLFARALRAVLAHIPLIGGNG